MSTHARIYLDYNATSPLGEPARRAMAEALAAVSGNPSSIHAEGRAARDRVERARASVAQLVGRPREQIVLTSGGTEANALGVLALAGRAEATGRPRVVATTAIEHPSLLGAVAALERRGWTVLRLPVDADGRVGPHPGSADIGVAALSLVNHELGTILDPGVLAWARRAGALVHVDAVQAAGKLVLDGVDADGLAISAHKIGGPQGAGALAIALDDALPILAGGHQEHGRRPGTENLLGVVGFGAAAAAIASPTDAGPAAPPEAVGGWNVVATWPAVAAIGRHLESGLVALGACIHGATAPRTGGTINSAFEGARGDAIVIALDLAGVAASTGAACTSGSVEPSPVLLGLGQSPERARLAVRFSLGRGTVMAEIDTALQLLPGILARARGPSGRP